MELMSIWRKRMSERRTLRRLVALLAVGGVSMAMMGEALAAEPEAAKPAEAAETPKYVLEDVVVTAERIPTKRMDTPANVAVITAEEIEDNHYSSVAEALSHVNGVFVSNGASGNDNEVRINGDERVVILVDGRRINNDQGSASTRSSANLESIASMKNIERIEVIKGGGSALYGSDAVGGVVNIITKKGEGLRTTLDVNAGSWGTYNYELSNEGSIDKLSWFVTGGFQRRNHFDYKLNGSNNSMPNSDQKNNTFTARVDAEIDNRSSVRVQFEHKSIHGGNYTHGYGMPFREYGKQDELYNNVAVSYHFKEGTKTPGFLRVYNNYKWVSSGNEYWATGKQNPPFNTNTIGVEYQNGWTLSKTNSLIAGAEWRESNSESIDPSGGNYSDKKIRNAAAYLQDTWNIAPKWSLVPGVRIDRHSMFGTHWTPKAAINYNADDNTQIYASWGRVFKAPTADDLYYHDQWDSMLGNPDLKPESGHTETIGITHKIDDTMTVGASYFWSELHDAIKWAAIDQDDPWSPWKAFNINYEKKHGIELSIQKQFDEHWSMDAAYSYINVNIQDPNGQGPARSARNQAPNTYRLGIHFKQGPWKANLMGTLGSGLDRNFYTTSSYTLIDFNASYDITKNLTAYFKVNNLTNQEYQVFPLSAQSGNLYPGKGRFFQIGVSVSF